MRIIFTVVGDSYTLELVRNLQGRKVDFAALIAGRKLDTADFPQSCVFYDDELANPDYYQKPAGNSPYALSEDFMARCYEAESIFLSNSDRLAFFPMNVRERKMIYYDVLLYWYTFLKQNPVDAVIFTTTPHSGWDNVLYSVAENFGIRIIILEKTCMNEYMFLLDGYKNLEKTPAEYGVVRNKKERISDLKEKYGKLIEKDSYLVKLSNWRVRDRKSLTDQWERLRNFLRLFADFFRPDYYYRRRHWNSAFFLHGGVPRNILVCLDQIRKIREVYLRRYYKKISTSPDYSQKYIYFALHFQPERSSLPLGGFFENQLLALDVLAKSLPEGWKLLVKEHPKQLKRANSVASWHFRNRNFYNRIKSMPNVSLISLEEDSKKLIQNAQIVATIAGTAGWEALIRKKNCLVFGYAWYEGCRNCYHVTSVDSCRQAIHECLQKTEEDIEMNFWNYIAYYFEKILIHSVPNQHHLSLSQKDGTLFLNNLSEQIMLKLNEKRASSFSP